MRWFRGVIAQAIARQENGSTYDGYESTHLDRANEIVLALHVAGFSIVEREMAGPVPDDKTGAYVRGLKDAVAIITTEVREVVRAVESERSQTAPDLKAVQSEHGTPTGEMNDGA